jgi:hypothetical protein
MTISTPWTPGPARNSGGSKRDKLNGPIFDGVTYLPSEDGYVYAVQVGEMAE